MLIYIESKVFPQKTFVLLVNQLDAIARARAQMLHILYELGKSDHQFRFRYKGIFLRDAYTFEDYKILDSSVLKMVPMAKQRIEIFTDANTPLDEKKRQVTDEVQQALLREVAVFNRRESILQALKVFLWLHFLSSLVSLSTVYFYSCVWTGIIVVYGFNYCPTYTRLGGFVATSNVSNEYFFVTFGLGMLLNLAASLTMASFLLLDAIKHGCGELKGDCSDHNIWSILFFFVHSLCLLATLILLLICFFNCRIQVGDIIEYYLVQNKDITKVLKVAGSGSLKDRRNAAFELASLAATGDEAKHKIVHKQGLEVLMNLALCQDEATQEYATEALAELLTVSQIQDRFIELGGARTLCALLHSSSQQLMGESVMAISYIVADSDANKHAIVVDEGLYDLSSAAQRASAETARIISGIYLELSFTPEIRKMLVQDSSSGEALEMLCKASDEETQRLALQTLELLAIETPEFIVNRSELLDYVIGLPSTSSDDQLKILASKIILYYAEIPSTCEQLVESSCIKNCLLQLSHHPDAVFQNVVVKIILAILNNAEHRREVLQIGIIEALTYLHENSVNRDTWDMAEKAIDLLHHITVTKREDPETASNSTATTGLVKRNASRNTSTPTTTL